MTLQEFELEKMAIGAEYRKKINDLYVRYAMSNNPVSVGCIVEDHIGLIQVEKIKVGYFNEIPECVYYGIELKKNLEPKSGDKRRDVSQSNLINK